MLTRQMLAWASDSQFDTGRHTASQLGYLPQSAQGGERLVWIGNGSLTLDRSGPGETVETACGAQTRLA